MKTSPKPLTELLSLHGKTALVTGAAAGIGRATVERYAEAGASLQLVDIDADALAMTAEEIQNTYGNSVDTAVVDLGDREAIRSFWQNLSPLPDILINNAGIFWPRKLEELTDADYDRMMDTNTRSVVLMCQEMIKRRDGRGGTIVNISSIEAMKGMTYDMLLYGASKAAILAISRGLVKDYAKKGWKVNTLLPGGINTPGTMKLGLTTIKHLDPSVISTAIKFKSRLPAKSMGQPDDIARAALWLGTPLSDYMNGAEVVVDGGFLAV